MKTKDIKEEPALQEVQTTEKPKTILRKAVNLVVRKDNDTPLTEEKFSIYNIHKELEN